MRLFLKKTTLFACFFAAFLAKNTAQDLLPFLGKNGQIGIVDENGKRISEAEFSDFEQIWPAHQPSFRMKKGSQNVLVLQNGMTFDDAQRRNGAFFALNFEVKKDRATDTLGHLVALDLGEKRAYVNLKTGQKVKFSANSTSKPFWLEADLHRWSDGGNELHKFRFGTMRVGFPDGSVNFIDTTMRLLFDQNFAAATVVDDQFFIVADASQRFAIADRTGKIRSKMEWEELKTAGKTGFFIAVSPNLGVKSAKKGRTGLINADGKTILQSHFFNIRAAGDGLLIIQNEAGEGIADCSGRIFLEPSAGRLEAAARGLFVRQIGATATVIDSTGREKIGGRVRRKVEFMAWPEAHFASNDNLFCEIFDLDGRPIFADSFSRFERLGVRKHAFFKTISTRKNAAPTVGLVNFEGKTIIPPAFDDVQTTFGTDLFQVKKGDAHGILGSDGREVLPSIFIETQVVLSENGPVVFGREKGKSTFLAFDSLGKRWPERDCIHPNFKKDDVLFMPFRRGGERQRFVFSDGSETVAPQNWGRFGQIKAIESPAGILVFAEEPGIWNLYDSKMRALVPVGFSIPRAELEPLRLKKIGLATVFQENPNAPRMPSPVEEPTKKQSKIALIEVGKEPPPSLQQPVEQAEKVAETETVFADNEPFHIGSGLMNARGDWVIRPKKGARFQAISWNLALEYPLFGEAWQQKRPVRLHQINHAQPAVFEIDGCNGFDEKDDWANCRVFRNAIDPASPTEKKVLACWFQRDGEQLGNFVFSSGPTILKSQNAVEIHEKTGPRKMIIDQKTNEIKSLDQFAEIAWQGVLNGFLAVRNGQKWGLLDSMGRVVLPTKYARLFVLNGGKWVQEEISSEPRQLRLLDLKGQTMAETDEYFSIQRAATGHEFIEIGRSRTLLFSPDGQKTGEVAARYRQVFRSSSGHLFGQFCLEGERCFWVDLATGFEFREK